MTATVYRKIQYEDYEILLHESIVQKLIERFDPKYKHVRCELCSKYYDRNSPKSCRKCPVGEIGCGELTRTILNTEQPKLVSPGTIAAKKHSILHDEAVKIKEWFENLPKVSVTLG